MNTHRITRIGQVGADGQFKIVNSSESPVPPILYPEYAHAGRMAEIPRRLVSQVGEPMGPQSYELTRFAVYRAESRGAE